MAILFIEGFEHQTATSLLTGWGSGPQAISATAAGGGARGVRSGSFAATSGFGYAFFRQNLSAARPTRVRRVHMNFNFRVNSTSRSNPLVFGDSGATASASFRTSGGNFELGRSTTALGSASASPFSLNTFYPFKLSAFIDNTTGAIDLYRGERTTPSASVSGVDTQGGANNYADCWGVVGQNFQSVMLLDDVVVYAPSILLDVGSGAVAVGDTLTINGTATVVVSDVDTTPDAPAHTVAGTLVRVWVHTWNEVTFSDGDTVTGGTLGSTTVVAPVARFLGGFEPWSWPQYEAIVGRYVERHTWTANGTVNLTPVGSATNVENVDNVPLNTTAYNEATSGANLADTYNTPIAIGGDIASIEGIQVRASGQSFGAYVGITATLTDGSGAQALAVPLSSTAENQALQVCELDSVGAIWGTTLPTSGTYELTV